MATLHVHLDESGDWNFNPKGSRYFVLTAAWTYDPLPLAQALTALRFGLVKDGHSIDGFHASPDRQVVRDAVVQTLVSHSGWRFASVVIEKCKVNPILYAPPRFYPTFASALLRFILRRPAMQRSRVLVYADTLPMDTRAKKEGVLKALKTTCSAELPAGCHHYVNSHRLESNCWLQVADYCCWAVMKKWQTGDVRTYDELKPRMPSPELEITARGDGTVYYK